MTIFAPPDQQDGSAGAEVSHSFVLNDNCVNHEPHRMSLAGQAALIRNHVQHQSAVWRLVTSLRVQVARAAVVRAVRALARAYPSATDEDELYSRLKAFGLAKDFVKLARIIGFTYHWLASVGENRNGSDAFVEANVHACEKYLKALITALKLVVSRDVSGLEHTLVVCTEEVKNLASNTYGWGSSLHKGFSVVQVSDLVIHLFERKSEGPLPKYSIKDDCQIV